jgi:hypothetical protein
MRKRTMKKLTLVLSVLMMVTMSAGVVLATEKQVVKMENLGGKVMSMDAKAGTIMVMTKDNKEETLKASHKKMKGCAVGEEVIIEKSLSVFATVGLF